jgi:ABC-type transporter Mla subunit MlaD
MELVVDFLLLAASGTAGLFCWVLSRKLKAMTSAEAGLGAGIAALSQSAEEMKRAVAETKSSADETAARIESLLAEAEGKAAHLQALIDQLTEMSASVADHAENATKKYLETLEPFLAEANETANRLLGAIAKAPDATARENPARQAVRKALAQDSGGEAAAEEFFVIDETQDEIAGDGEKRGAAA